MPSASVTTYLRVSVSVSCPWEEPVSSVVELTPALGVEVEFIRPRPASIECVSVLPRALVLSSAVLAPALAMPSQKAT